MQRAEREIGERRKIDGRIDGAVDAEIAGPIVGVEAQSVQRGDGSQGPVDCSLMARFCYPESRRGFATDAAVPCRENALDVIVDDTLTTRHRLRGFSGSPVT